jgi:hypothetical protein
MHNETLTTIYLLTLTTLYGTEYASKLEYEEPPDYDYLRRIIAELGFGGQQLKGFEWLQTNTTSTNTESGDTMPNTNLSLDSK